MDCVPMCWREVEKIRLHGFPDTSTLAVRHI
jgi:hypothetical protein